MPYGYDDLDVTGSGAGSGDMTKATYDGDDDGRVEGADQVTDGTNTVTAAQARNHIDSTSNPHGVTAAQASAIPTSQKAAASGVASLDANSEVVQTPANLPQVASLAALKALAAGRYNQVYLSVADRRGYFYWDSSDNSANVTSDPSNGVYVPPDSDTTGASGAWVRQFDSAVRPRWFGGTTQAAIEAALAFGFGAVDLEGETYTLSSTLTIDISNNTVYGDGATLSGSGLGATTAVAITGATPNLQYQQARNFLSGVQIVGPGKASSATGLLISPASGTNDTASHSRFSNVVIRSFGVGIEFASNAYIVTFDHFSIYNCGKCVNYPSGLTNAGERITFQDSTIFNSTAGVDVNSGSEFHFINCSFDFIDNRFIEVSGGGHVFLDHCHIEGNSDNDYWLYCTGFDSHMVIRDTRIYVAATKTAYTLGFCDTQSGLILFDGISLAGTGSDQFSFLPEPYLVEGYALFQGTDLRYEATAGIRFTSGTRYTLLANPSFEEATLYEWSDVGSAGATISTANPRTGAQHLRFAPGAGANQIITKTINLQPGQSPVMTFWMTGDMSGTSDSFIVEAQYFDASAAVIDFSVTQQTYGSGTVLASYQKYSIKCPFRAKDGANRVRFLFKYNDSDGVGHVDIDDVGIEIR